MVGVSGVRGVVGTALTPEVVQRYAAAFGALVREGGHRSVVLARDSRESGPRFAGIVRTALTAAGCRVIDCGLVSTPTAQLAVEHHHAGGGIIVTASHNPREWNALKFVGPDGVFLDQAAWRQLDAHLGLPGPGAGGGQAEADDGAVARHLDRVLGLSLAQPAVIRARRFRVALDCVRGAGGPIMVDLLARLGCAVEGINLETDGRFPRAPEPVPANLGPLADLVRRAGADIGLAVDPDVDRLALVDETGVPIGEDYTLAFAVAAVLSRTPGPVVVNLSTSLVVDDAAREFGVAVERAPVGEANVARAMRARGAVVGGEGNGGVILPALHLGRDAPLAALLVLQFLATTGRRVSEVVAARPRYVIVKDRVDRGANVDAVYRVLLDRFPDGTPDRQDGLRLAWGDRWLHVRPSGTEPIIRLIAEARTAPAAAALIDVARTACAAERNP